MDGWIKWLGELVWRFSQLPAKVRGDEREENFYYRLYGVLCLFLSLVTLVYIVYKGAEPLSKFVADLTKYAGPDKVLAQGYAGALIAIGIFPIIIVMALLLATAISISAGVSLLVVKLIGWVSYLWAKRFKAKQAARQLTPEQRGTVLFMFLGLLAGLIIWLALKSGATPPDKPVPDKAPEPPDGNNDDARPAA